MAQRDPYSSSEDFDTGTPMGEREPGTGGVMDEARQRAGQTQGKAGNAIDQAKEQATSRLAGQKDRAAGGLESVAHAVRQTGQQLREQEQSPVAEYADKAAEQIERFSQFLREKDVNQMVGEAEDFARRQPALFLSGALLLGFMGARFLRSSRPRREYGTGYPYATQERGRYGYGGGRYESDVIRPFGPTGRSSAEGSPGRARGPMPQPYPGSTPPRNPEEPPESEASTGTEGAYGSEGPSRSPRPWRADDTSQGYRPPSRSSEGVEDE